MTLRSNSHEPGRRAGLAWRTNRRSIVDVGLLSNWLFLLRWPPIVLGAEEIRKRLIRRRP
jgi:hypothetical protein